MFDVQMPHHEVHPNLNHMMIIPYISAGGMCFIPYVIISQDSGNLHDELPMKALNAELI
jgi:hypothetical protein